MPEFLNQLQQAGALNIYNPAEQYKNALMMKAAQQQIRGASLDMEAKVLTMGKEALSFVQSKDDYANVYNWAKDLGIRDGLLKPPEEFETDEEATEYALRAGLTAAEYLKYKQGEKSTWSKINDNGTVKKIELYPEQVKAMTANKLLEGYEIGEITGTPRKSLNRIKQEKHIDVDYAGKKKAAETKAELTTKKSMGIDITKEGKEYVPDMTTIYGPEDQTKRVSITKGSEYTPPKGWSLKAPSSPDMEERILKGQELTSIRQDKAALKREIARLKKLPNVSIYKDQKSQQSSLESELRDIEQRENKLLKRPNKKKSDPLNLGL